MDITGNAQRVERTQRDVRLDGLDHYYAVFQVAGESTMIQNDQAVKLAVGDAALVDLHQPVTYVAKKTYVSEKSCGQWSLCSCRAGHWCPISIRTAIWPWRSL
jgi:hypothetical protein